MNPMNKPIADYDRISFRLSKEVTKGYSTSFFTASRLFSPEIRYAIWSIYGFVRLADEIVDTFLDFDQKVLLEDFQKEYELALKQGISLNPILHAFQITVRDFDIPERYVLSFLASMKKDLVKKEYVDSDEAAEYIYGSADVVGLMCLKVFCKGNTALFEELESSAMRLGSAFQKVNFLRDLRVDQELLGRTYFPEIVGKSLDEASKKAIVMDIEADFKAASVGLAKLPGGAKPAVKVAFDYYKELLRRIDRTPADEMLKRRIRVPDGVKLVLFFKTRMLQLFNGF